MPQTYSCKLLKIINKSHVEKSSLFAWTNVESVVQTAHVTS